MVFKCYDDQWCMSLDLFESEPGKPLSYRCPMAKCASGSCDCKKCGKDPRTGVCNEIDEETGETEAPVITPPPTIEAGVCTKQKLKGFDVCWKMDQTETEVNGEKVITINITDCDPSACGLDENTFVGSQKTSLPSGARGVINVYDPKAPKKHKAKMASRFSARGVGPTGKIPKRPVTSVTKTKTKSPKRNIVAEAYGQSQLANMMTEIQEIEAKDGDLNKMKPICDDETKMCVMGQQTFRLIAGILGAFTALVILYVIYCNVFMSKKGRKK